jgi:hypothetical protein
MKQKGFERLSDWQNYVIDKYEKSGKGFKEDKRAKANYEIVADFVADVLFTSDSKTTEQFLKGLNLQSRNGFIEAVKRFFAKLKAFFVGDAKLNEVERLEKQFLEVANKVAKMNEAETEQQKTTTEKGSGVKYSYPGPSSLTANRSLMAEAISMKSKGESDDKILQETGWFQGGDGKWRYLISDAAMEFHPKGNFTNPDLIRYRELQYKYIADTEKLNVFQQCLRPGVAHIVGHQKPFTSQSAACLGALPARCGTEVQHLISRLNGQDRRRCHRAWLLQIVKSRKIVGMLGRLVLFLIIPATVTPGHLFCQGYGRDPLKLLHR